MRDNVIVAYRGANYELGQWPYGYGIWNAADQEPLPLEWWDPTPEGWSAAWYRFAAIEVPGTIAPASPAGPASAASPVTPATHAPATPAPASPAAPGGQEAPAPASPAAPASTAAAGTAVPVSPAMPGESAAPATPSAASAADPAPTLTPPGPADSVAQAPATPPGQGAYSARPAPFFGPSAAPPPGYQPATAQPAQVPSAQIPSAATPTVLSTGRARLAAGLLAAGVVLGIIGLFPSYSGGSLASQASNLWPHLIYLAGWVVGAVLIFRGGRLQRSGALVATGLSVVTFGLFLADVGFPIADGSSLLGAGLVLSLIGWAACAAGSVIAFGRWPADWPRRPLGPDGGVIAALIVAALGVAITFAPAWDRISLPTGSGVTLSETLGNMFSNPGPVIAGDILVLLGLVAVVAVAALWRPARLGWALIAGAMIPMVAQIISAAAQLGQPTTAAQLGITPAQAAQLGISTNQAAHTSLTAAFWLYCMFVAVLLIGCAWLAFGRDDVLHLRAHGYNGPAGYGPPAGYGSPQPGRPATPAGYVDPIRTDSGGQPGG